MNKISFVLVGAVALLAGCGKGPVTHSSGNIPAGKLILNHAERTKQQYKTLTPVVKLEIGDYLCSSTHVGNGVLLTAYHCVQRIREAEAGKEPELFVDSPGLKEAIGPLTAKDYTIDAPKIESTQKLSGEEDGKPKVNRVPDLAVIKLKGDAKTKILTVGSFPVGTTKLSGWDKSLVIAGYGRDGLPTMKQVGPFVFFTQPSSGTLDSGIVNISSISEYTYDLKHRLDDKSTSAALPGDSGGPLLRMDADGKFRVYGVTSTLGIGQTGGWFSPRTTAFMNNYSRLDRKAVQDWFVTALRN